MMKQKYGNGYWIGLTTGVCPECLSIYYFVPFSFLIALLGSMLLCGMKKPVPFVLLNVMYWGTNILMTFGSVKNEKKQIGQVLLPIIFFLLHIAYGVGTLVGLIQMPFKRKGMFHSKEGDRR